MNTAFCEFCEKETEYAYQFDTYVVARCNSCNHLGITRGPTMTLGCYLTPGWATADKEVLLVLDANGVKPSELF